MIKAFAQGGAKGAPMGGSKAGAQYRVGRESMGRFYRRTGKAILGGNARTRGVLAPIRPVRG